MRARRETTKPSLLKRALACLVSAAMVVAFTPVVAWGSGTTGDFTVTGGVSGTAYEYANNTLTIKSGTPITISGTTTTDHIVVAFAEDVPDKTANITLNGVSVDVSTSDNTCAFEISPGATVNLTLLGSNTLKSGKNMAGLQVDKHSYLSGKQTIIETGSLTITNNGNGSLTATGGEGGAGIGSRNNDQYEVGEITIEGGTVNASGGNSGAGIGGGFRDNGGTIEITGGIVTANGGERGAGIGGGQGGDGGSITISGGTVTANGVKGEYTVSGIGGGGMYSGSGGGSGTFSTGENGNAVIFASSISDKDDTSGWSGVIFEGATYSDEGLPASQDSNDPNSVAITRSLTIGDGKSMTVGASARVTVSQNTTLTIESGGTLTNNGTLINEGTIANNGVLVNKGAFTKGTFSGVSTPFLDESGLTAECYGAAALSESSTAWTSGWYVVNSDVIVGTADSPQRITVNGDVHLILKDGCKLTVNGGIQVNSEKSLTVYGQQLGTGSLTAVGKSDCAGIAVSGSAVTINGGKVEAIGGGGSAGIGGDNCKSGGVVRINGGDVTATGGDCGAGIGGGVLGGGGEIVITGGTVTASGSDIAGGAGIGGGGNNGNNNPGGTGGKITISGGVVKATSSGYGAGIGGGTRGSGGDITISGGLVTATSGNIGIGTDGAGIGGGGAPNGAQSGQSGTFKTQEADAPSGNAVVFANMIADKSNQGSWSGVIFEGDSGKVYGSPTLYSDLTFFGEANTAAASAKVLAVPSGSTLSIAEGKALTVASGSTLSIESGGALTNKGAIYVDGTLDGSLSANSTGVVYYPLALDAVGGTVNAVGSGIVEPNGKRYYSFTQGATLPTNVAKSGYTFEGWYDGSGQKVTEIAQGTTGLIELTARWTAVYVPSAPAPDPVPEVGNTTTGVEIPSAPSTPGEPGSGSGGSASGSTTVDVTVTGTTEATDSQGNKVDGTVSVGNIETTAESVAIPETITTGGGTFLVTEIPAGAMAENSTATTVTIPESVTSIGEGAFQNCTELTSVSVPSGVTTIEQSTFAGCTSLQSVEIKGEATEIASNAFAGCTSLESVEIPASVTTIGEGAFAGCESLTSVTIPAGATVGDGAFAGCTNLTSVTIPADATIAEGAFAGTGVTQVTIASNATVGEKAFANSDLNEVKVSGSATVGERAFQGCEDLTKVVLGKGLKTLPAYLFKGCSSLRSVTVPSTVTKVGRSVFSGCDSLKKVVLPKSVKSIGRNALYGADKVRKLTVNSTQLTKKSVKDCLKGSSVTTVYVPKGKLKAYSKIFTSKVCGKKVELKAIK